MRCMDISSASGTVSQVKESASRLLAVAKKQEIPMFIVGLSLIHIWFALLLETTGHSALA